MGLDHVLALALFIFLILFHPMDQLCGPVLHKTTYSLNKYLWSDCDVLNSLLVPGISSRQDPPRPCPLGAYTLEQGCQTHCHRGPHQPHSCLPRAKCNFSSLTVKE